MYHETLCIKSSLLDPHGPFQLLNALRSLEPQATHTVVLSFEPNSAKEFNEVLELHCPRNTLSIRLKGRGVTPAISLSIPDGQLDLGDALVNDSVVSTFKINNTSELAITYNLRLDSQSSLRHSRAQALPGYLEQYKDLNDKQWPIVGPSNCNGVAVIDCVPERGVIAPGESKEITVTFAPDHPSVHYVDVMSVVINDGYLVDFISWFSCASYVITAMLDENHKASLIGFACSFIQHGDQGIPGHVVAHQELQIQQFEWLMNYSLFMLYDSRIE
ncbi:Cilia- and flagella-associated protein 74 [Exaiptasia diaphana]|nr:Cilia- and flagella-associated protein 74 [Exaiptasia diaphana]